MTIWIYSYPRSGNSLVAQLYLASGERRYEQRCHPSEPDGIDRAIEAGLIKIDPAGELVAKTHFWGDVELEPDDVLIIPYRDGRDALTSFWQYDAAERDPIEFWEELKARDFRWDQWMGATAGRSEVPCTRRWFQYEAFMAAPHKLLPWKELHSLAPRYFQSGKAGRWRDLPQHAQDYLQRELRPALEEWGYA